MTALDCRRICIAAQLVGVAQAALDDSIKYARQRQTSMRKGVYGNILYRTYTMQD